MQKITSIFNAIKNNKHSMFVVHGENRKQPISIGEMILYGISLEHNARL